VPEVGQVLAEGAKASRRELEVVGGRDVDDGQAGKASRRPPLLDPNGLSWRALRRQCEVSRGEERVRNGQR
jgi:hypothetical protein